MSAKLALKLGLVLGFCLEGLPGLALAANLTKAQAMKMVLQADFQSGSDCGNWRLSPQDIGLFKKDFDGVDMPAVWRACPHRLDVFREAGQEKAYLLLALQAPNMYGNNCHICSPWLGAAIFEKSPTGWSLVRQSRYLAHGIGTFGKMADSKLVSLGPNRHAILFESGYTGQGVTIQTDFLFAEVDHRLVEVWNQSTDSSNAGMAGTSHTQYAYTSKIEFVPMAGQDWPELHQIVTGTYDSDVTRGHVHSENVSGIRIFRFDGHKYQAIKSYRELGA